MYRCMFNHFKHDGRAVLFAIEELLGSFQCNLEARCEITKNWQICRLKLQQKMSTHLQPKINNFYPSRTPPSPFGAHADPFS